MEARGRLWTSLPARPCRLTQVMFLIPLSYLRKGYPLAGSTRGQITLSAMHSHPSQGFA